MQKQMPYKKIIICICAAAAIIAAALIVFLSNKEEAFRSILVYEVEGTAVIEREGVGTIDAAENLYLESGDRVSVAQDSSMRMKLDDDKYVTAEADTIFSVEAEGTDENSRTKICLEQGAVTNEIQKPLSEESQYETSTPNSVMAVRGTIYRAELYIDDNGNKNTKLCCFQGKVGASPILPDGTYGEEVLVLAGSELIVYSDGTVEGPRDITYGELPGQVQETLRSLLESGQSITGITLEELNELIVQTADGSEEADKSESKQAMQSDAEGASGQNDVDENTEADTEQKASTQADKDVKDSAIPQTAASPEQELQISDKAAASPEQKPQASDKAASPEQKPQTSDNTQPAVSEPGGGSSDSVNTGRDYSQGGNNGAASDNKDKTDKNKPDKNKTDKDKPDKDNPDIELPEIPPQEVTYTVTFEYQGTVFAVQEVKSGERASLPLLIPAQNGVWDFDFRTEIMANTTITWKE